MSSYVLNTKMPYSTICRSRSPTTEGIAYNTLLSTLFFRLNHCRILVNTETIFLIGMYICILKGGLKKLCHIFRWINNTIRWFMDTIPTRLDLSKRTKTISKDQNSIYLYYVDNSEAIKGNNGTLRSR